MESPVLTFIFSAGLSEQHVPLKACSEGALETLGDTCEEGNLGEGICVLNTSLFAPLNHFPQGHWKWEVISLSMGENRGTFPFLISGETEKEQK